MMRRFLFVLFCLVSHPLYASGALVPVDADYGHFYRVACIPPLHYFAITREDYRGDAAAGSLTPDMREALVPYGLYASPGFGTCVLGADTVAWNVSGENWRTHIALNRKTLVEQVAILPEDKGPDAMISGFELVLATAKDTHELTVYGVWEPRSKKQKKAIGLVLTDTRAKTWFPLCDADSEACATYHFIQFPALLAPAALPEKSKAKPEKSAASSSNLHTKKAAGSLK